MGIIPYESRVDARNLNSNTPRLTNAFGAESFGAAGARALGQAGAAVEDAGDALRIARENKEKEKTIYAEAMFDPSDALEQLKSQTGPDGAGYKDAVKTAYQKQVDDYVAGIDDDNVRTATKERLLQRLPAYTAQAEAYERKATEDNSKDMTNKVLGQMRNKVLSDPSSYDLSIQLGQEAISTQTKLAGPLRADMQNQWEYDITKTRFDGMLTRAKTPAELDAVKAEMEKPDWQDKLMPKDYEDLTNKIMAGKKQFATAVDAQTKAELKDLEERSKDPVALIPPEQLASTQKTVAASQDVAAQQRMARIVRDQKIVQSERKFTPAQLRATMQANTNADNTDRPGVSLPPEISAGVNDAAAKFGISASFLDSTILREYGGVLKDKPGDYTVKADTSSATGILQFTDGTFLGLAKNPSYSFALGVTKDMTDAQILDMRKDPQKAILAGAMLAKQNKGIMEDSLGRPVTDTELYMAHFLGAPQAVKFLQSVQTNPDAVAATVFPAEAEANPGVFYKDPKTKQEPFTVAQVSGNISRSFTSSTSQVAYDDNSVRQNMLTKMETALNGPDALKYAASVGVIDLPPLDSDGGFEARAKAWQTASTYYGRQMSPFTSDEEAYLQKYITDGTTKETLGVMASIQKMGPEAARAGFAQLKVKNPAFGQAGMLALDGDSVVAGDIVRGVKRMKENPAALTGLKFNGDSASADFENIVGPSLARIAPAERQAVQEAALAYMVETSGAGGKKYDKSIYKDAVTKVLGGRIEDVNGEKTFLPKGVTAKDVTKLLGTLEVKDYVALSPKGSIPLHADGQEIDPRYFEDEVKLRAIGGDRYVLADADGSYIWTGQRAADGSPELFVMSLAADRIRPFLDKKVLAANTKPQTYMMQ